LKLEHDPEKACPALDVGGCRASQSSRLRLSEDRSHP
jgi:hypothetical protein